MYKKCYQGKKLGDNYFEMHLWEEDGGHQGCHSRTVRLKPLMKLIIKSIREEQKDDDDDKNNGNNHQNSENKRIF